MWWYLPLLWALLAAGLVPGVYFVMTFRPIRSQLTAAADVAGLGFAVVLLYARSAVMLLMTRPTTPTRFSSTMVVNLVFAVGIDVLLWLRAVRWWGIRRRVSALGRYADATLVESDNPTTGDVR